MKIAIKKRLHLHFSIFCIIPTHGTTFYEANFFLEFGLIKYLLMKK